MIDTILDWVREFSGRSGRSSASDVTLYTRPGCHLCDDALDLLKKFGLEPEIIDIDQQPTLLAKYDTCVPVVVIDGKLRFRGHVDERLLKRLLRAT